MIRRDYSQGYLEEARAGIVGNKSVIVCISVFIRVADITSVILISGTRDEAYVLS